MLSFQSANTEHPKLTNHEIIIEVFQPVIMIPQRHGQTTSCSNTSLRTIVYLSAYHSAEKINEKSKHFWALIYFTEQN